MISVGRNFAVKSDQRIYGMISDGDGVQLDASGIHYEKKKRYYNNNYGSER